MSRRVMHDRSIEVVICLQYRLVSSGGTRGFTRQKPLDTNQCGFDSAGLANLWHNLSAVDTDLARDALLRFRTRDLTEVVLSLAREPTLLHRRFKAASVPLRETAQHVADVVKEAHVRFSLDQPDMH